MARALAGLPVDGDPAMGFEPLVAGLKGAAVEVRSRAMAYRGRLVDLVATVDPDAPKDKPKPAPVLVLLTDRGEIVRIPSPDVLAVRPLDANYATRLGSALDALSVGSARSERPLHVLAHGGPISLGYVAETPVWRTTYRLILDRAGAGGVLEGWALLHNDTDEDWHGVRVELANGKPDSFLFPLAAPRYARRPLVAPEDELATVPQLMGTTVDNIWGDRIGDSSGAGGLGMTGYGEGGGGSGSGIGLEERSARWVTGPEAAARPARCWTWETWPPSRRRRARRQACSSCTRWPIPSIFTRMHPALVPFALQHVDAKPIAWFESASSPARSAVRFVNSTSQTLPAGTLAFFADGGFAGESSLERLKPGEKRFVTYGLDLDIELSTAKSSAQEEPKRLVWNKNTNQLQEHYVRTSDVAYSIENRSGAPRRIFLGVDLSQNAELKGSDGVDYDTASGHPLAIFDVDPHKRVERAVHAVEGLMRGTNLTDLTAASMEAMAASPSLAPSDRSVAGEAVIRLREVEENAKATAKAKEEVAQVQKDIERLREDMKAFGGEHSAGAAGGANPFAARVLAGEDKLASLRKKLETFEADAKVRKEAVKAVLVRLALTTPSTP